jgi:hypothetical protein
MHCANCRHDNPSTTRFCHACGAVLVEDAPGVGRRRVLRPWGLRRSAPPTISPDLPEIPRPRTPRFDALVRLDLMLAAGVVVAIVAATVWFPRSMASDAPVSSAAPVASEAVTVVVSTPLRATSVTSPALVEPAPPPAAEPQPAQRRDPPRPARSEPRPVALPEAPAASAPVLESPVVAEPVAAPPPPPPAPPKARDRWDALRESLAACRSQGNILERAMCEQGARIRHCTEHWDVVELCPSGRPAITQ